MPVLHTIQQAYEIFADATTDQTALDGSAAGYTIHFHDLPARTVAGGAHVIDSAWNGVEIIAESYQDATDDSNAAFMLWGYVDGGPVAEYIGDISCTVGTARINDVTTALYIDTMVISENKGIRNMSISDTAANRVAKLTFDCAGYKYLVCKWYDISGCYRTRIRGW